MNGWTSSPEEMCQEYINKGKGIKTFYPPPKGHKIVSEYAGYYFPNDEKSDDICAKFHDQVRDVLCKINGKEHSKTKVKTILRRVKGEFGSIDDDYIQLYCQVIARKSTKKM